MGKPPTVRETFEIRNKLGLHARAAVQFVQLASKFDAEITVTKDSDTVNGKSIIGLMTLAAALGTQVEVSAEGPQAEEAMRAIGDLITRRFDEEE